MAAVGERGEQHLTDKADEEARAGDEAEPSIAEAVLVLQVAEQGEDDAVGDADAGRGEQERIPTGWVADAHTRWVAGYVGDNTALLYGDLDLGIGGNEFAGFNKSTRGWQLDQRLPGGGFMRGFYIQEKGVVRNQTFVGNDTPGPYFLTFTPVIEGSEVVKVNEDPMRFGSDYRLDYDSGQLYFEPIDGQARIITAADTISVSYQSLGYNDGGPGEIYGARAEMPLLNDKLLLGLTMLRHDRLENSSSSDTVGFQEDIYNGSGSTGPFDRYTRWPHLITSTRVAPARTAARSFSTVDRRQPDKAAT